MLSKVTYFDTEYANNNNRSICQIGLMCEDYSSGEPFFPERSIYLNPEDGFDPRCVDVHGITKDKVKDSPTFPEVWPEISQYFTNAVVIGHNVSGADLNSLCKSLIRYNLDIPELYYVDTLEIARRVIPPVCVDNYSCECLCDYFGIDIENAHDAFDDACSCKDLLKALVRTCALDIEKYVHHYSFFSDKEFETYASDPAIRKAVTDVYGIVNGLALDAIVNQSELDFFESWKKENRSIVHVPVVAKLMATIDDILSDKYISADEFDIINEAVAEFSIETKGSKITYNTQLLNGILKGIAADGVINDAEAKRLEVWLYDNADLKGHFPYDQIYSSVEKALEDGHITPEESRCLIDEIKCILDPIESLQTSLFDFKNKSICLSGCFQYGQKSVVAAYLTAHGAIMEANVKKSLNLLIVGDSECEAFSNGTFGTKVVKAMELNEKGAHIQVAREKDINWNL